MLPNLRRCASPSKAAGLPKPVYSGDMAGDEGHCEMGESIECCNLSGTDRGFNGRLNLLNDVCGASCALRDSGGAVVRVGVLGAFEFAGPPIFESSC